MDIKSAKKKLSNLSINLGKIQPVGITGMCMVILKQQIDDIINDLSEV